MAQADGHGGTVLLSPACASFDQYPNFEVRGEFFVAAVESLPDAMETVMNMAFARTDHSTVGRWWWTVDRSEPWLPSPS